MDEAVRSTLAAGESLYTLDIGLLKVRPPEGSCLLLHSMQVALYCKNLLLSAPSLPQPPGGIRPFLLAPFLQPLQASPLPNHSSTWHRLL